MKKRTILSVYSVHEAEETMLFQAHIRTLHLKSLDLFSVSIGKSTDPRVMTPETLWVELDGQAAPAAFGPGTRLRIAIDEVEI